MIRALTVVCACLVFGATKTEGSQFLPAPAYIANYASSYDSHVVNHDVRYPVAPVVEPFRAAFAAPYITPVAAPAVPVVTAPLTVPVVAAPQAATSFVTSPVRTAPVAAVARLATQPVITPFAQAFSSFQSASFAAPLPAFQLNSEIQVVSNSPVELARSSEQKPLAPQAEENPSQLSRSTQARQPQQDNGAPTRSNDSGNGPVPSSILASSQFLARKFSSQQGPAPLPQQNAPEAPNQQGPRRPEVSARSSAAPIPLQRTAKPVNAPLMQASFRSEQSPNSRFLVAGNAFQNNERLNGDDSESVEVTSADSGEVPTPNRKELQPVGRAEGPKARLVYSPLSVLRSPFVPNAYAQVITF